MTSKFDSTKPVSTRDGRKVRILADNIVGERPIAAAVQLNSLSSEEFIREFHADGSHHGSCVPSTLDLINIPERIERFVNIYGPGREVSLPYYVHKTEQDAKNARYKSSFFGLLKLTFEGDRLISYELQEPRDE